MNRSAVLLLFVLVLAFTVGEALAQKTVAQDQGWTRLPGQAADLALAPADGTAYAVDPEGRLWKRAPGSGSGWTRSMPGTILRVAADVQGDPWVVFEDGRVGFVSRGQWKVVSIRAKDIGAGSDGSVWAVLNDGGLAQWDAKNGRFKESVSVDAERVGVDPLGRPWFVTTGGRPARLDPEGVASLPGQALNMVVDLAVGPDGEVYASGPGGELLRWSADGQDWTLVKAPAAAAVAVGPGGRPWVASPDGVIQASDLFDTVTAPSHGIEKAVITTGGYNWQVLRGSVLDLGIGADGAVWAVGLDNSVWRWSQGAFNGWSRVGGRLARVAVAPDGTPWGVDPDGGLLWYNGAVWKTFAAKGLGPVRDVALGPDGQLWVVTQEGAVVRLDPDKARVADKAIGATGIRAQRIAVDPKGRPWVADESGAVFRYDGQAFEPMPGTARDLGVGPDGTVFIVSLDGEVARWDRHNERFILILDRYDASAIAVGPGGKPWIADADGTVVASAMFSRQAEQKKTQETGPEPESEEKPGPVPSNQVTETGALAFTLVEGKVRDLGVGPEGHVYAVGDSGQLLRFNDDERAFEGFSLSVKADRVAVDKEGKPWVVTVLGQVYHYDGTMWRQISGPKGKARDVAVGLDDTVVVSDDSGRLYEYRPGKKRLILVQGRGDRLGVDPQGAAWAVDLEGRIWNCLADPCQRVPGSGRDIGIGPDGSIFLAGEDGRLLRYGREYTTQGLTGQWERVPTKFTPINVSVGPKGLPWVATPGGEVYAAGFFHAPVPAWDKGKEEQPPTITFKKSYRMEIEGQAEVPSVGPEGDVYMLSDVGSNVTWWDGKRLKTGTHNVPGLLAAGVGESYWYEESGKIYEVEDRDRPTAAKNRSQGFDCPGDGTDLDVGPDNVVFAISSTLQLYRYTPETGKFKRFDNKSIYVRVCSDPAGNPWIVDANEYVKYWDGDSFEHPAKRKQRAADVGVGPDGSVFIVTPDFTVYRFNATNKAFDRVTLKYSGAVGELLRIDVSDQGAPWMQRDFGGASYVLRPRD